MKEPDGNMNNYWERFNKMYELEYDLSWLDKEIPQEVRGYIRQLILEKSLDVEDSRIMDLGCGRGKLLYHLEQEDFKQVVGVDVSNVAAQLAKPHTERSEVLVADVIEGLPFKDNTFSLVTELTVLSSLNPQHWSSVLNEIYRVLNRGGFYISEIFTRDQNCNLNQPLITRSVIPRELDQVYGVTRNDLVEFSVESSLLENASPIALGQVTVFLY